MKSAVKLSVLFLIFTCTLQIADAARFSLTAQDHGKKQFSFEVKPGESVTSAVIAENLENQPINISIYGVDGTQSNLGTFALTTRSAEQKFIGKWVAFTDEKINLGPLEKRNIAFTVKVPGNVTPGVYGGGIAAESGAGINGNETAAGNSISVSSRMAVKLFVTVPGEKISKFNWESFTYTPAGEQNGIFRLKYKNEGNTVVKVEQTIRISGFPGIGQTIELPAATLLQNGSMDIPVKWDKEPFFGYYTAKATMTFSELDVVTNKTGTGKTDTRELSIYIPLKTSTNEGKIAVTAAILLALLLASVFVLLIRNYLFRRRSSLYTVQPGDTLVSIAGQSGVKWKKIARLNKIKAPYSIKAGDKILTVLPEKKK